ncbi:hypothetical protein K8Q96_02645 [Candidatus Nomurabacteria bacterium]|nr:hypothetical protein [Candidatus Nomurabacteria bacterium]
MEKINKLLEKFCEEKNLELIFPKKKLQTCRNTDLLNKNKYSTFIIINEKNEEDLMIRDLENPIIQNMARENSLKNCFYCQFGCSIESNNFLRVIVVENDKKAYIFSEETISNELYCPDSDWDDDDGDWAGREAHNIRAFSLREK